MHSFGLVYMELIFPYVECKFLLEQASGQWLVWGAQTGPDLLECRKQVHYSTLPQISTICVDHIFFEGGMHAYLSSYVVCRAK